MLPYRKKKTIANMRKSIENRAGFAIISNVLVLHIISEKNQHG